MPRRFSIDPARLAAYRAAAEGAQSAVTVAREAHLGAREWLRQVEVADGQMQARGQYRGHDADRSRNVAQLEAAQTDAVARRAALNRAHERAKHAIDLASRVEEYVVARMA